MEGNSIALTTAHAGCDNKNNKKVKTDESYKQESVTKELTEQEKAEKLYGMKF